MQSAEEVELPGNQISNEGAEAAAHDESVLPSPNIHLSSSAVAPPIGTVECTSTPASLRMVDLLFSCCFFCFNWSFSNFSLSSTLFVDCDS